MLTLQVTAHFAASIEDVWDALTNPDKIRIYFFGTNAISDWTKGSRLDFTGEWEGVSYHDKGTILDIEPPRLLRYNYFSAFSGKEDLPENYHIIVYELSEEENGTRLVITQEGLDSEERKEHSQQSWTMISEGLRKLVEKA